MIEKHRMKLREALSSMGADYSLNSHQMLQLLQSAMCDWSPLEDFPKYEIHNETRVIRNRNTHRVLKPNNCGFVKVRNKTGEIVSLKQGADCG